MIEFFKYLDLELSSYCFRRCVGCIRNSHPNRKLVQSWFSPHYMSKGLIRKAIQQCIAMKFEGEVCLSHYNEPLLDERLPQIAEFVHQYFRVFLNTNGDFLTEELAQKLDGHLDKIIVSLYMEEPIKSKRAEWIRSLFNKTEPVVNTMSDHIATHYSPSFDVVALAKENIDHPCIDPQLHCIINHKGKYLLCCDDVIGNFRLGSFPKKSIKDYWFGAKHMALVNALSGVGGRRVSAYCSTCPRR